MKRGLPALVRFLLPPFLVRPTRAGSLAIACLVASIGCLSPQDIEVETPPASAHLPPYFDVTKDVTPDSPVVCISSLDAEDTEFRIDNIQDPSGQALTVRWFMDYEDGNTGIQSSDPLVPAPGSTTTNSAILHVSQLEGSYRTIGHAFFLDAVISDGFDASSVSPKNRAILPGDYSITYRWTVEYLEGSPCPETP